MDISIQDFGRLRRTNALLSALHLGQAVVMLALTNSRHLPVTAAYGNGPPGQPAGPLKLQQLFTYRIGWGVAAFMLLSALFHGIVASPWGVARYRAELQASRNRFRWVEYSLSSSLMIFEEHEHEFSKGNAGSFAQPTTCSITHFSRQRRTNSHAHAR